MRSYQKETKMKTIILLITLTIAALQAESTVYYDTTTTDDSSGISKPNHPTGELY